MCQLKKVKTMRHYGAVGIGAKGDRISPANVRECPPDDHISHRHRTCP